MVVWGPALMKGSRYLEFYVEIVLVGGGLVC